MHYSSAVLALALSISTFTSASPLGQHPGGPHHQPGGNFTNTSPEGQHHGRPHHGKPHHGRPNHHQGGNFTEPTNFLSKREEKTVDENGNLRLTFSKRTVNIGGITVDQIGKRLGDACHTSGLCETNDIAIDGLSFTESSANSITLTLGPDGEYDTAMRNGLLDALLAAVNEMKQCKELTYQQPCLEGGICLPADPQQVTNCEVPAFWGVKYETKGEKKRAEGDNITTDLTIKETDGAVCEKVMTALGAVAGAVNGPAGSAFTLLSFACV